MIEFLKMWTEGIIVAIIIATIIEILLPDNSNKKYIRIIIGIYILFTIINPILNKFSAQINLENIMASSVNNIEIQENITDDTLTNVFKNNLKANIKNRLELLGHSVDIKKIEVSEDLNNISFIELEIIENEKSNKIVSDVQNINIDVKIENTEENILNQINEENTINKLKTAEIKKILKEEYGIENISIK